MTDKAYIVANKEQELDVLNKFDEYGFMWGMGDKPSNFIPSEKFRFTETDFPYMLIADNVVWWATMDKIRNKTIVYDGRKEEKMYKVTQEFMNELIKWRDHEFLNATDGKSNHYIDHDDLDLLPAIAEDWRLENENAIERNKRLIAIIKWLNGEDVFEVEEPHKFVVRSEKSDNYGDYIYVQVKNGIAATNRYYVSGATKFDTREEAQEWANSHQVVVEIDAEGNEVE